MGTRQLHHTERMVLQGCIAKGCSLNETVKRLKVSRSTIYRELHRNIKKKITSQTCGYCSKLKICKNIGKNNSHCINYNPISCVNLKRFPYVCNHCKRIVFCRLEKHYYDYEVAGNLLHERRKIHHLRISVPEESVSHINQIVSNGIRKGQSLHHIYVNNHDVQIVSERTIRRWLYSNRFSVKSHQLPRFVAFPHKREYRNHYHRVKNLKDLVDRTYQDYRERIKDNPDLNVIELDSVVGKLTDLKALLTIYTVKTHFMFGVLINKASPVCVNNALYRLRENIGIKLWKKIFPIILTDNGTEFEHLPQLEFDKNGEKVTNVYYCDPYSSFQKGECERNHELIRYIFAKGKTLDNLTQDKVNLMFSHINSYSRAALQEKSPYELTKDLFGDQFLRSINIVGVEPSQVHLKFDLLK